VAQKDLTRTIVSTVEKLNKEWAGSGRILVRPSGTEPLIRVLAEAENAAVAQDACASIASLVRRELG
jgi:phosphoglucosamine mutase